MNTINLTRWHILILVVSVCFLFGNDPLFGEVPSTKSREKNFFQDFPWIGLIANEISYGPITVSDVYLNNQQKLIFVKPNEKIKGSLNYRIDASKLDSMHLYHLVVGIKRVGAQDCITHSFGIWDSAGRGNFTLLAPSERGVYEVRFCYFEGLTCQAARNAWNTRAGDPSSAATIAAIIVE